LCDALARQFRFRRLKLGFTKAQSITESGLFLFGVTTVPIKIISLQGGECASGYAIVRNLPDGAPFRVTTATLRQMNRQRPQDTDILQEAVKELDRLNDDADKPYQATHK